MIGWAASVLAAWSAVAAATPSDPGTRALLDEAGRMQRARSWAAADSVTALALARAESATPRDSASMAAALFLRGNQRLLAVRFQDPVGRESFERAIRIHSSMRRPDTLQWVRTHLVAGRLYAEQDDADGALAQEERARSLCSPTVPGSDSMRAEAWITTGRTHRRTRDYDRALEAFESARVLRERALGLGHPLTAATWSEIGAVHIQASRFAEGRAALDQAIAVIEGGRGPASTELVAPLGHLANLQYQLGDIAGSIESLERVIAILAESEGPNSVRSVPQRYNLALRLIDFGDYDAALEEFRRLVPLAESQIGPTNSRTRDILTMAGSAAILAGDTSAATGYLDRASAALAHGPTDAQAAAWIERWRSALRLRGGDAAGARSVVEAALRAPQPFPAWFQAHLLEARLDACMALGDRAGVRSTVAQFDSLSATPSGAAPAAVASAQRLTARGLAWLGDDAGSWERALRSEQMERSKLESNLRTLPDRRGLQLAGELAEPLDLVVTLAATGDAARLETAWDRLVRWRGMVAAEMATRKPPREALRDTAVSAAHARWVEARRHLAFLEVSALASGDSSSRRRLAAGQAAAEEAERRYAVVAGARGLARDTAAVSLARVRAAIGDGRALVSIVEVAPRADTSRVVAFVARGAGAPAQRVDLGPRETLRRRVEAWRAALSTPPPAGRERQTEKEAAKLGEAVRAAVWAPLAQRTSGVSEVVIVADGVLAGLPWGALPDGGRYLAETGPAIATPGAERELLRPAAPAAGALLAVGDPDFDLSAPGAAAAPGDAAASASLRGPLTACASGSMRLAALPGARAELQEVAQTWAATRASATTRIGAEATEAAVKRLAPDCAMLHLATHGIVWGDSCAAVGNGTRGVGGVSPLAAPQPSPAAAAAPRPAAMPADYRLGRRLWLALAGANHPRAADENEGLLTADEVAVLDLRGVDWVVLSACHSGVAETWPREGALGMQRAFHLAGARSVIASQWAVADQSTREWMGALYAAAAGGTRSASQAVALANRTVLEARRRSGRTLHPFYWAAFTSSGR